MKVLLVIVFFTFCASASAAMHFRYEPNEGAEAIECTHKQIKDLPDWDIECGEKKFSAHVIVRPYFHERAPKTKIEILYWVVEPGKKPRDTNIFHSSSFMVRLKEKTDLYSVSLSQGVENDFAGLTLELDNNP